jgi:hypothetical protein
MSDIDITSHEEEVMNKLTACTVYVTMVAEMSKINK